MSPPEYSSSSKFNLDVYSSRLKTALESQFRQSGINQVIASLSIYDENEHEDVQINSLITNICLYNNLLLDSY